MSCYWSNFDITEETTDVEFSELVCLDQMLEQAEPIDADRMLEIEVSA